MQAVDNGGRRRRAERWGHLAEWLGALFLLSRGYRILALRYKTGLGEIDLVVRKGNVIAFVEVKSRRTLQAAVDAVNEPTKRRIRAASDLWISRRRDAHLLARRYDILAIRAWRLPVHFKDAF
ncbi:YraN family protein [Ciceribacter sp. L1K23]|uniref:YraN family protein n=1 Tax=unclassified Ciceribacter TaxID=2628820 RepID=UPI001ABDB205|nr:MULTISPECIES: YraN family protein [unclassified Ciceribacter]MBO3758744.1 YraN family protein [Ciceribacter sp. L1K22]MBR0557306.1 YraN family protein [Ciceribacter sp. L1K23]